MAGLPAPKPPGPAPHGVPREEFSSWWENPLWTALDTPPGLPGSLHPEFPFGPGCVLASDGSHANGAAAAFLGVFEPPTLPAGVTDIPRTLRPWLAMQISIPMPALFGLTPPTAREAELLGQLRGLTLCLTPQGASLLLMDALGDATKASGLSRRTTRAMLRGSSAAIEHRLLRLLSRPPLPPGPPYKMPPCWIGQRCVSGGWSSSRKTSR